MARIDVQGAGQLQDVAQADVALAALDRAGDDPVNLKDPSGKDCAGGPTTPTALANFIAAYEAGVFDQYELGVEFDDAVAAQEQVSRSEAPATSPSRSSNPSSGGSSPSGVAQGFQSVSNALGTLAVGADVADAAELGTGLLPAETVSYPATVILNGLSTGTGCVANILGDGGMDNCYAGIAIFVGTAGFGSYSAVHAVSAAVGDAVTVYNDVTSYAPWNW